MTEVEIRKSMLQPRAEYSQSLSELQVDHQPRLFFYEDEVMEMLKSDAETSVSTSKFQFQEVIAVVWNEGVSYHRWYVGFVLEERQNSLVVDHLERHS